MKGRNILTLGHIEHSILRPLLRDPRGHFAINGTCPGCPRLREEAYRGNELAKQISEAAVKFLNDPERNYFRGNNIYLSSIFYWFRKDFGKDLLPFIMLYAGHELAGYLSVPKKRIPIKYLVYDWSLKDISDQRHQ